MNVVRKKELSAIWYSVLQHNAQTKSWRPNEQKLDQRRVKDQSPKKEDQKSKQQEETLVEKVKQADIENGAVPTISDRSETSLVWMVNLNQGLALKR